MSNKSNKFRILSVRSIKSLVLQNKETESVILLLSAILLLLDVMRNNLRFKRNSVFEIYIKSNLNIVLS